MMKTKKIKEYFLNLREHNLFSNTNLLLSLNESHFTETIALDYNYDEYSNKSFIYISLSIIHNLNSLSNFLNQSTINDSRQFMFVWWVQVLWSLIFGILVLQLVIGNSIVIWIILANKKMRTVNSFFLLNLSISDLASTIFNTVFNFVFMLNSHWPFVYLYCVFTNFMTNLTISSTVFTMTATSIDRFEQKCL